MAEVICCPQTKGNSAHLTAFIAVFYGGRSGLHSYCGEGETDAYDEISVDRDMNATTVNAFDLSHQHSTLHVEEKDLIAR